MSRILRIFMYVILLGTCIVWANSCKDDDSDPGSSGRGTITGTVTDNEGQPLPGVDVTVSGIKEEAVTVTTGDDGKYTVENVTLKLHAVKFAKNDWLTVSVSVTADEFDADNVATKNIAMISAAAKILGTITDARNGGAPLSGVTVSISADNSVTSGSDGTYAIENLIAADYTVTFTKANYVTITKNVTADDFVAGVVTLNVQMGSREVLRGLTADDLAGAAKWYYNEYRGGRNPGGYPHWDWSCDYMCTLNFTGAWQEQSEGTAIQIRNSGDEQSNPADTEVFDSFVYGSKKITEDNKILSVRARTFSSNNTNASDPVHYGVQVIDLSAAEPEAVKIGDTKTTYSESYEDVDFDLSNYVGKEVVIAIGTYRWATGNYFKQLSIMAIRFASQKVEGTNWLPGTEVVTDWKLTQEMVRSTMPHTKKSFTGISPKDGNGNSYGSGNYSDGYRSWRTINHVAAEWSFVPLHKDTEPFPSEGYLIKTRGSGTAINTIVPEAYLYSKFSIAPGSNQLTFKTRNFSADPTYFKVSAVEDNGTVTHLEPQSNTAGNASAAEDGCWKFVHQSGDASNPNAYASFVYDLSQFNGKDVIITIGVYKGANSSAENKLVFRSIELN